MKAFKKKTLLTIGGAALSLGMAGTVQAGALAYSSLEISDFQIFNNAGNQWDFGDFDPINIGNTGTSQASLTGNPGAGPNAVGPLQGNADVGMACTGPDCAGIGQNDFSEQNGGLPASTSHFSRADSLLEGAIISGVPGGVSNSADANTVAEVQLNQSASGASGSFVGTTTTFKFSLAEDDAFDFQFDGHGRLDAFLHQPQTAAQASYAFSITIKDLGTNATVFNWSPDGVVNNGIMGGTESVDGFDLTDNVGVVGAALPVRPQADNTGSFRAVTDTLSANVLYSLTISHNSDASATAQQSPVDVPEPATLAILGAGLFGIAITRRRRKA
ncbi:EDSAP-1 family PEP-CTERM protein [Nitrosococcus watsonii]|uniref:Ice-binding protein C-terminal domain-containing protein n=1 Tax=Nitrosococcus watsoni (strain C-113) TaxID=105559 RepID=D8K6X2_NITWC|nr:EDSAP-1 family PEP-CTERM protein [Nitrosococcus watsonii]ADJ28649.1 protein of unknown function DUF1555 [Nitrosococcus watsonii C-113]